MHPPVGTALEVVYSLSCIHLSVPHSGWCTVCHASTCRCRTRDLRIISALTMVRRCDGNVAHTYVGRQQCIRCSCKDSVTACKLAYIILSITLLHRL
jgi:hypothetical protein